MIPTGVYTHNGESTNFSSDVPISQLTTNGTTTGPSEYVLKAGIVDKDKPQEMDPKNALSILRARLTNLQDQVNSFLTTKMVNDQISKETETKLLDGADSDSD